MARERVVVDTNALVSHALLPSSAAGRAVARAVHADTLLASDATLRELGAVLARPRFDAYASVEQRQQFFRAYARIVELVPIVHRVQVCRDPKDDMFLGLAVNGQADAIMTGDRDLLALHPFRAIPILSPASYLERARS